MKEFSTETVAVRDRFARFEEITSRCHLANHLRSDQEHDFRASLRMLHLGDLQVTGLAYPHLEVVRTPKLIRQDDPEIYQVHYLPRGQGALSHAGRQTRLRGGHVVVADSSAPYRAWIRAASAALCSIVIHIPRAVLPIPHAVVRRAVAVPIPAAHGIGGVFARWLSELNARAHEFTPADVPALADTTTGLLASLLGRVAGAEDEPAAEARRGALQVEIRDFIHRHLDDPALCPATVAAAHGISVRHLHQLFAAQNTTPASWIRHRRLERCRHDLTDPRQAGRPVQAIGARWGFTDASHFSRVFRAAYGVPPREYRHSADRGGQVSEPATSLRGPSQTAMA
ncbi:helix-turn-helix domain-containing protein [Streptomyces sp. NPDC004838]